MKERKSTMLKKSVFTLVKVNKDEILGFLRMKYVRIYIFLKLTSDVLS